MEIVDGKKVRVIFDGSRCIHARNCVLSQPGVFKANVQGPWIDPDAASPEELLIVAARCPSGAIRVERLDGGPGEQPSVRNVVAVVETGPYAVRGDLRLAGAPASERWTEERVRAALHTELERGASANAAAKTVAAQAGWTKREAYELIHSA